MNGDDLEMFVIEIDNAKDKNVIVSLIYRPPNRSIKTFHEYLKLFLDRTTVSNKNIVLIGDFNLNLLDFNLSLLDFYYSHSVKNYLNELFKNNLMLINKGTHVASKSISAIDHINTNFLFNSNFNSGIIKANLSTTLLFLWLLVGLKSFLKVQNIQEMHKLSLKEYSQNNKLNNPNWNYANFNGQKL